MYTIDDNLPWFTDLDTLEDGIYVNILSKLYSDDENPNGLYFGFINEGIFHTSIWNGSKFTASCIPINDIDSYLYVEYFVDSTEEEVKETHSEQQDIIASLSDKFKEELEKQKRESQKTSVREDRFPWHTNPYGNPLNTPYDKDSFEDAYNKFKKNPIITLGSQLNSKEAKDFLKGFNQLLQPKG